MTAIGFLKKDNKQSEALLMSERMSSQVANVVGPRDVSRVAVIGAGTMGGGIATSFVDAGIPVKLIEASDQVLKRGLAAIQKDYEATTARGGLTAAEAARRIGMISAAVGLEQVKDADLIVEAVFETMQVKRDVFASLDKLAKPGAVLATNTSYLDVNVIAAATNRPQDVVRMHFFSPANIMKRCEIAGGTETAPDVLATARAVANRIGKVPVVVGVCHGFVGNRMLGVRIAQARKLLLEGASPTQIDAVAAKFGMMGPFAMGDLAGLDVGWRSRKDSGLKAPVDDALCEAGRFGLKTGAGFYRYEQGSRTPIPDPEVETLVVETARRLNIRRRDIDDAEIHERLIFPIINEGARILEEGIVQRASDIDLVWLYGFGWPPQTGGPMSLADQIGLAIVAERLAYMAAIDRDETLRPVPLLERRAMTGGNFASLWESDRIH